MSGPYRAEFGAVFHEAAAGFLFTVSPPEHATTVAEALNRGEEPLEIRTEAIKAQAGDLLVVFCDAPTPEAYRQLRGTLEPLSHALNARVLALPTTARLEHVEGELLARLAELIRERVLDTAPGSFHAGAAWTSDQTARVVAEAAGELGLVILKAQKGKP